MSEPPERPSQPGAETHVAKEAVAAVQAALDATFNLAASARPGQVERELRTQLAEHGAAGAVSDAWISEAVERLAAGEPVVAEPGDA